MPFKSQAQRRWMYSQHPKMAKKWEKHTSSKSLPDKVKKECAPRMTEVFQVKEALTNVKYPNTADTQNALRNQAKGIDAGKMVPATQIATAMKNTAQELQKDPQKKYKVYNGQVAMEPEAGLDAVGGKPIQQTGKDQQQKQQSNMLNPFSGRA